MQRWGAVLLPVCLLLVSGPNRVRADQVEMQNGDRYAGKVMSLNSETLVIQSENLGIVRLPRGKVALISLGSNVTASAALTVSAALTNAISPIHSARVANASTNLEATLRQLRANTNLVQQVQSQLLAGAGPEVNTKFNELLNGLSTGKISVNDLRSQAQSAADQLRAFKRESGDDTGDLLDTYLSVLDEFLRSSAPAGGQTTNVSNPPLTGR